MGQQNGYLKVIVVHSTMHLMHHNHCQITITYLDMLVKYHIYVNVHVGQLHSQQCIIPSCVSHYSSSKNSHLLGSGRYNVVHPPPPPPPPPQHTHTHMHKDIYMTVTQLQTVHKVVIVFSVSIQIHTVSKYTILKVYSLAI